MKIVDRVNKTNTIPAKLVFAEILHRCTYPGSQVLSVLVSKFTGISYVMGTPRN